MRKEHVAERGESRFVSNTVALVVQTVAATLLTLLQVKLLSNLLARDTFGLFASLRGFSLLLASLAASGLPQLLVRFVPVHEARRESHDARRLVWACIGASVLALVIVSVVAQVLGRWAFGFVPVGFLTGDLYVWFYATTLGVMLKLILYGGLNGLRRLTVQTVLETLSLLAVLLWIVFERRTLTLPHLFRIIGVVDLVTVGVGFPLLFAGLRSAVSSGEGERRRMEEGYRREYAGYFGWAVGLSLVAIAFSDADRYLLAHVLSLDLLAAFHIGARVGRLANRLLGVANLAFQPEVTRLDTEGRDERVVESTWIFLKFNSIISIAITAALVVFAREAIVIVSSAAYVAAVPLLVVFALSLPLTTITAPVTTVMKARDQVYGALWCDLAWAVVYVGTIFLLTPRMGLVGVGCAQLLASGVQLLLALRLSRLPLGAGRMSAVALKLFAAGSVAFLPAVAARMFGANGASLAGIGLRSVLFLGGVFVFRYAVRALRVLEDDERTTLRETLDNRRLGVLGRVAGV